MQSPSEIQETITKEHEELEQLKTAKKKNSARISELENHAVELGLTYGQALSNERQFKKIIADNTAKLKSIPTNNRNYVIFHKIKRMSYPHIFQAMKITTAMMIPLITFFKMSLVWFDIKPPMRVKYK
ncbi:MAG: hypothetical protein IJR80_05735 [Treponema sp.]|nr:hypothetical protein [Treponema sp.]